jgi:UDP-N-acetyl-D-glucosamine dehydrogenase
VAYADPFVPQLTLDSLKLTAVEPSPGALAAADCVLILTNHSRFDYAALAVHAPHLKAYRGPGRSIFTL